MSESAKKQAHDVFCQWDTVREEVLADELAAAEERGLRRGVEACKAIAERVAAEWRQFGYPKRHHGSCACLEVATRIAALAPRDSAPELRERMPK